jgi:hypothetical protein
MSYNKLLLLHYAVADVEATQKFYENYPSVDSLARMFGWQPTEGELVFAPRWDGENENDQLGRVLAVQPGPSILVQFVDFDNSRAYFAPDELRPLDAVTALARLSE